MPPGSSKKAYFGQVLSLWTMPSLELALEPLSRGFWPLHGRFGQCTLWAAVPVPPGAFKVLPASSSEVPSPLLSGLTVSWGSPFPVLPVFVHTLSLGECALFLLFYPGIFGSMSKAVPVGPAPPQAPVIPRALGMSWGSPGVT